MGHDFYKLPIKFNTDSGVIAISKCNELESIDQSIELILTTCPGEHRFNKNFGCRIWDMDFELVFSRKKWEETFTEHIRAAIRDFEKRLQDVNVSLHITEVSRADKIIQSTAIKKQVSVFVSGSLVSSGEHCKLKYILYLSPLSTE
jgi:phage baseplate assembly protein W